MADLPEDVKNRVSHRAKAAGKAIPILMKLSRQTAKGYQA
jgi:inosine/xanthosine triphosphate pyrophosphatase family protein